MKHPSVQGVALVGCVVSLVLAGAPAALAGPRATAGPYRVEITTLPGIIPVGQPVKLLIKVTDVNGRPLAGAQVRAIAQMPGMQMGEHEETALPQGSQTGLYVAPAQFAMEGGYEATLKIVGSQGIATATLPLHTGENTVSSGAAGGPSLLLWLPWLLGVGILAFVVYRVRRTGQRIDPRPLLNWRVVVGLALLAGVFFGSQWAIRKYTPAGHMDVITAQDMDMSVMKAPVGAVPVAAMAARREPIQSTVRYTGLAVPYLDQDVTPRVTGTIAWMPAYPGNRVSRGQLLARLDTRELNSRVDEQTANVAMAGHTSLIARMQYRQALGAKAQALAQVEEARNDVESMRGELAAARQEATAAQDEREGGQTDLESARAGVADAQAQSAAAQADQTYWSAQIERDQALLKGGALSLQEFQQDQAQAQNVNARLQQANAKIRQVDAAVRSAQFRLHKAEAMLAGAQARVAENQAKVRSSQARVDQTRANARAMAAAAEAAEHEIAHSQAGVAQAKAGLATARVVEGYTEIRSNADGVVTQRLISPGVLVQPGQVILKVAQIDPIRLQVSVAESDISSILVGSRVRAWSKDPEHPIEARVTSVFPSADPIAHTSIVEAVVPNAGHRFLPGDFVTMDLTTGANETALVVPASSVLWQPQADSAVLATRETPAVWVLTAGRPEQTIYTCTMHPEVKQDHPGKCPT